MNTQTETVWTETVNRVTGASSATAPPAKLWECAWHVQEWNGRAWFGEDHIPFTTPPDPLPTSHGMCARCAKIFGIEV